MGPKTILSTNEEAKLCVYIELMVKWEHPMIPTQLKAKVAKITQDRVTLFKKVVLRDSWVKWFTLRHLDLVLRVLQGLDHRRVKALNLENVA